MKRYNKVTFILLIIALLVSMCSIGLTYYFSDSVNAFLNSPLVYVSAGLSLLILFIIFFFAKNSTNDEYIQSLEKRLSLWNTISYKVKGAGENVFSNHPIGVIVIDKNQKVMWSNAAAQGFVKNSLDNKNLKDIVNGKLIELADRASESTSDEGIYQEQLNLMDRMYLVSFVKNHRIFYLRDIDASYNLNKKYQERTLAVGYLNVDNLEDFLSGLDQQTKSESEGKIIKEITDWADKYNAFIKALGNEKYIFLTDRNHLEKLMDSGFTILDEIKVLLKITKPFNITISMGIVCEDLPVEELFSDAQAELDLATTRGGDQVVVKLDDKKYFYGAKTDPVNKESKVETRDKYLQLEDLVKKAKHVYCIGHTYQDADSFGSCVAMYNFARSLNKDAYIIALPSSVDNTVKRVLDDIKENHETLFNNIISPDEALKRRVDGDLLIIVDVQVYRNILLSESEISKFTYRAVIDHHRKNEDKTVNDCHFYQLETGASSCIEVIFSLLEFAKNPINFSASEACWMMLGLVVDTNNFTYRTSYKTFEVAATLNRYQASQSVVKNYLKESRNEKLDKNDFVKDYRSYAEGIAIAVEKSDKIVSSELLAKSSDDLLSIDGIELAISVGFTKERIGDKITNSIKMSARSLGRYNCQTILERIGGGGHLNAAACVFPIKHHNWREDLDECVKKLEASIDIAIKELNSSDNIRIILKDDIKNIGLKGDVVQVIRREANLFISQGRALEYNIDNIKLIEQEKKEVEEDEQRLINKKIDIKNVLESEPLIVKVRLSKNNNFLDEINTKLLATTIKNQWNIDLDRKTIKLENTIKSLGSYDIMVQLGSDVIATLKIHVIENKE